MEFVRYLPLLTTAISAAFAWQLLAAWRRRRSGPHLLWWFWGVVCYGLGTLIESSITLSGNTVLLTKCWYIAGALLGGLPLAQGVAFLHLKYKTAMRSGWIMMAIVVMLSILVLLSPVVPNALDPARPSGSILEWRFIRFCTPVINLYAFVLLVGGAIRSAVNYAKKSSNIGAALGNVTIAVGGLLPGIGGASAKAGHVEVLYVLELLGLILLWIGSDMVTRSRHAATLQGTSAGASLGGAASPSTR